MGMMRRRFPLEVVLVVAGFVALSLAIYFRVRYGDVYRIGDSEHRRAGLSDQLAFVVPAAAFVGCMGLLALRRLSSGSIRAQWKGEQELLRRARGEALR